MKPALPTARPCASQHARRDDTDPTTAGSEGGSDPRLQALADALARCPTREAWCDVLVSAVLAVVPAERAIVALQGRRGTEGPPQSDAASRRPSTGREISSPIPSGRSTLGVIVVSGPPAHGGFGNVDQERLNAIAELAGRYPPPTDHAQAT